MVRGKLVLLKAAGLPWFLQNSKSKTFVYSVVGTAKEPQNPITQHCKCVRPRKRLKEQILNVGWQWSSALGDHRSPTNGKTVRQTSLYDQCLAQERVRNTHKTADLLICAFFHVSGAWYISGKTKRPLMEVKAVERKVTGKQNLAGSD